jgi:CheY-like chemotaxis protein/two-component sensor histidine kinase
MSDGADPTGERVYEIMERQVGHLVRLVDDLLDASRITHGKIELQKRMAELAVIVESAVEASRPFIDAARHQLAISLPQDPVSLEADPVRLSQVITNLLTNAAKYMDNGGQIWLTVRREGCEAVVSVRDTGIGIPPDMLPRVFDMFAQVDKTSGRAQGGLGIGLSLARRLVEMHGGRIEAFSEGPGQGSEFIVRLPVRPLAAHSVAAQWGATPTDRTSLPARRILVVDDTRAAVYTLGKLLEKMGQHVRAVESAEAALEAARQERPDVVISDIAMPNMSGYELARRIREEPELEDVILIALTGFGQESDRQQAKEAGFDFHLIKPVGIEALRDLLASLPAQAATSAGQ